MYVNILSYLANKLEIRWIYLSPFEKMLKLVPDKSSLAGGVYRWYLVVITGKNNNTPKVVLTSIYYHFIDLSTNYVANSPGYSLFYYMDTFAPCYSDI